MRAMLFVIAMLVSNVAFGEEWTCNYGNVRGTIGLICTDGEYTTSVPTFGDHRDSPDVEAALERIAMLVEITVCGRLIDTGCTVTVSNNPITGTVYAFVN